MPSRFLAFYFFAFIIFSLVATFQINTDNRNGLPTLEMSELSIRQAKVDILIKTLKKGEVARLRRENLHGVMLAGVRLRNADLNGANLSEAMLAGADLGQADLENADLQSAMLLGADLRGANLTNANLKEAMLLGVRLEGARIDGANFTGSNINQEQVDETCGAPKGLPGGIIKPKRCETS
jgi:uncharacterized protein YjbI with pentapeptide repeats